jgi:hypothetical protein
MFINYSKLQMIINPGKTPWSSGKGEDSRPRGRGFESRLRCRDHYHAPLIWIKSMKKLWKINLALLHVL